MRKRSVIFPILLLVLVFAAFLVRRWNEPQRKEAFDRHPQKLVYTKHALCRMDCRYISKKDVEEIMEKGVINFGKSYRDSRPCPSFALQGHTTTGKRLRIVFGQCGNVTNVITCIDLEENFSCYCPGDNKKEKR